MSKQTKRIQPVLQSIPKKDTPLTPIKILEKYSPSVTEFDSVKEFQQYLTDHKEEMDAMTTQKLNKTFKVFATDPNDPDSPPKHYTITKIGGEISLKIMRDSPVCNDFSEKIAEMEKKIACIITILDRNNLLTE